MTDDDAREWIEERAAILEYDANVPRSLAESVAAKLWEKTYAKDTITNGAQRLHWSKALREATVEDVRKVIR